MLLGKVGKLHSAHQLPQVDRLLKHIVSYLSKLTYFVFCSWARQLYFKRDLDAEVAWTFLLSKSKLLPKSGTN